MILVLVEHEVGEIVATTLETLTFARGLGEPVHAVAFGAGAATALAAAGDHGVEAGTTIVTAGGYAPAAWAQAIADLTGSAAAVVAAGTDRGNELLAHLAAKTSAPFVANCITAELGADGWTVTRQRWGGSLLEDALVRSPLIVLSVALHAVVPEPAGAPTDVALDEVAPVAAPGDLRVQATLVGSTGAGTRSLGDAALVVGGGRGVGSAEGFAALDSLAMALDGVVGVSRAVTSAGWRPHAQQIGQTGERIGADLYIACGISGASQHMVGCRGAKKLMAINTDLDAPILSRADYAVIGDLHQVVPAILAELERRRG